MSNCSLQTKDTDPAVGELLDTIILAKGLLSQDVGQVSANLVYACSARFVYISKISLCNLSCVLGVFFGPVPIIPGSMLQHLPGAAC